MRLIRTLFGRLLGQRGQSVIEGLMAVAVLGIAAQTTALVVRALAKQNVANRDRTFATEKALQMLEELRGLVLTGNATLTTLDTYSDGYCDTCTPVHPYYKWTLTTKFDVTTNTNTSMSVQDCLSGVDPHSANPIRPNGYGFVRFVDILSTTKDANVRMIYVRVYAAANNSGTASTGMAMPVSPTSAPLAEVYGEVHSQGSVVTPSQALDLYFVALENVPGWWSRVSQLIPLMESSLVSLQSLNPGLVIRSHWIQTLSYGRDLEYTPQTNAEFSSVTITGSLTKAYVYPGYIYYDDAGLSPANDYYYLPSNFLGRINVGGYFPPNTANSSSAGFPSDDANSNLGYAMADQFNNAMRYPDELNLYKVLCKIAENKGNPAPQVSWRMLLELLNENDPSVQNAIILNLHGEMVPVPPIRNYSDAAKDPDVFWANSGAAAGLTGSRSYRAVTQPERLQYPQDVTTAVNVYAYDANPNEIATGNATTINTPGYDNYTGEVVDNITLFVPGATTANLYQVIRTQGNSSTPYYRYAYCVSPTTQNTTMVPYLVGGLEVFTDATPTAASPNATFYADIYTAPGTETTGLRIQLYGTTGTARPYYGEPANNGIPSP